MRVALLNVVVLDGHVECFKEVCKLEFSLRSLFQEGNIEHSGITPLSYSPKHITPSLVNLKIQMRTL